MSGVPTHLGALVSGQVTCTCGWESARSAVASDAIAEFEIHLAEIHEQHVLALARLICRPYLQGITDQPCYVCRDAVRRLDAVTNPPAPNSGQVTEEGSAP